LYIRVITFLLVILTIEGCSQGWIIANIPIEEEEKFTNTVFTEIVDADSVVHWFHGGISDYDNWCYKHQRLEKVKVY
tara:strand:+ start:285 stop:515 length:231 start_codon:yes stop_codon:yes gene_type:complete